jgi:hypothetical protein
MKNGVLALMEKIEGALYAISQKFGVGKGLAFRYHRNDTGEIVSIDVNIAAAAEISQHFPKIIKWSLKKVAQRLLPLLEDLANA